MTPGFPGRLVRALVPLLVAPLVAGALAAQEYPSGGDGRMYIGTYDGTIWVLSEATGERVDRIPLETGIARDKVLSRDGRRFYVLHIDYETIEVVDIASKRTLDVFSLSEGNEKVRIWNYVVDPAGERMVLAARRYRRLPDRWDVGDLELLVYDITEHRVERELEWPEGEQTFFPRFEFSPDGSQLYFFGDDVRVYETEGFSEVERWEYTRSVDRGLRSFDFGFSASPYEEEGYLTDLFRVEDPVHGRTVLGVARLDLEGREVDFFTVGPDEDLDFTLAPDGRGYGLHKEIGNYQLWTFDLEQRRVVDRKRIEGRPRMQLEASSNGRYLYVWQAGNTIDLLDVETGRYAYTIELDGDTTTELIVVPDDGGVAAAGEP